MKILILGANGMIGHTIFDILYKDNSINCYGLVRSNSIDRDFKYKSLSNIIAYQDEENTSDIFKILKSQKPDIIINCIGITKHLPYYSDTLKVLNINSLLPHKLSSYCIENSIKLIHISTDCVFSGSRGNYSEVDIPDAVDLYGKSKSLGEIRSKYHLTIRTSTIGHELSSSNGLLEWFLKQKGCKGFRKAIFSGVTTLELARIIRDIIIPNSGLNGLYHVASYPIDKYTLLNLIAKVYNLSVDIRISDEFKIDRSLNSEKFSIETGYYAPSWEELITSMLVHSKSNASNV